MASSLFAEVERDMAAQGWMLESPFISLYVGDGHFVIQMRPKGEAMTETYSTVVETLHEITPQGKC